GALPVHAEFAVSRLLEMRGLPFRKEPGVGYHAHLAAAQPELQEYIFTRAALALYRTARIRQGAQGDQAMHATTIRTQHEQARAPTFDVPSQRLGRLPHACQRFAGDAEVE